MGASSQVALTSTKAPQVVPATMGNSVVTARGNGPPRSARTSTMLVTKASAAKIAIASADHFHDVGRARLRSSLGRMRRRATTSGSATKTISTTKTRGSGRRGAGAGPGGGAGRRGGPHRDGDGDER